MRIERRQAMGVLAALPLLHCGDDKGAMSPVQPPPASTSASTPVPAATPTSASNEDAGAHLPQVDRTPIAAALAAHVASGEVPGYAFMVRHNANQAEGGGYGARTVGIKSPVRSNTIFRIASMSKPMISALVMTLVEEKKLTLDEPVGRLLPELKNRRVLKRIDGPLTDTVPAKREITVRDLLTFRCGMGILMQPPGTHPIQRALDDLALGQGIPAPAKAPAPDEWMKRLGTLPLMAQPGTRWMYNTGMDIAGVLVARAANKPLEVYMRERIFEPLGMKDTSFSVPADKLDRFVTSYAANKTGGLDVYDAADATSQWAKPPAFPSGAGGLVSTIDDCHAFTDMMLGNGTYEKKRILSAESVRAMTTDYLTPEQKQTAEFPPHAFDDRGWGFGVAVLTKRDDLGRPAGTYGWDGGLGTSMYIDPAHGVAGVLLTQRAWTSPAPPPICRDFWTAVYADKAT